jgi:hypothetical protein
MEIPPISMDERNTSIVKMSIIPKVMETFNIHQNISGFFFTEIEIYSLEFIWNHKRLILAKVILNKKNKDGSI